MASQQLLLTSWLDDRNGPAKLTQRQQELVANFEKKTSDSLIPDTEKDLVGVDKSLPSDSLANLLRPTWKPNEVLEVFYDERENVIKRGEGCKNLAANVDSVLTDILALKNSYLLISPQTGQLYSECKNIIQERNGLREIHEQINTRLSKQGELQVVPSRMPDIKDQILQVLNQMQQWL